MRTSSIHGATFAAIAMTLAALQGCGGSAEDTPTYVMGPVGSSAGTGNTSSGGSGTGGSSSGTGPVGTGGSATPNGGSSSTAGSSAGGMATGGVNTGGTAPVGGMDTGGTGTGGAATIGHFKMLVYYETRAFRHGSIAAGIKMLEQMGTENDFDVTISDGNQGPDPNNDTAPENFTDPQITAEGLAPFDMVFFMNPTGDIFSDAEQTVFVDWLKQKKAFAGVHSATDTEHTWAWYEDLVGEIYDGHSAGTPQGTMIIEEAQKNHPAVAGIPSPWTRNEEWYKFQNRVGITNLPGLTILMRYGGPDSGGTIGQPLAWTREWEGIRSFYSAIGHSDSTFDEPLIRKHILGGILWAIGRVK